MDYENNNTLTKGWPPMSVGYMNLARAAVSEALREALKNRSRFTPIFWIGQHYVRIPMVVPV